MEEEKNNESLHLLGAVHRSVSPKAFSVFFAIYLRKRQLYDARLNSSDMVSISIRNLVQNTNMGLKRVNGGIQELKDSGIVSYTGEAREKRYYRINWDKIRELGQAQPEDDDCLLPYVANGSSRSEHTVQVNVRQYKDNGCNNGKTHVIVQPDGKVIANTYLGHTQSTIVNSLGVNEINLFCL